MGGSSSKTVNETTMRMTDITNNVTENISKTSQETVAKVQGIQNMTIGKPKFYGCQGGIKQGMTLTQDVSANLTAAQIDEAETALMSELSTAIKNDTEAGSGALRLPVGGSSSEGVTKTDIDNYIETNNLMKNVKETMQKTSAEIKGKQDLNVIEPYFDPCGIGVYKDMMADASGEEKALFAGFMNEALKACPTPRPECNIEQDMFLKQIVSSGVAVVAENITKHKKEISADVSSEASSKAKDTGVEDAYVGVAEAAAGAVSDTAGAAEGAIVGTADAAEGAIVGTADAAEGAITGTAGAVADVAKSPMMIIFIGLMVVGFIAAGMAYLEKQKAAGSGANAVSRITG